MFFMGALYLQRVLGYDALEIGLAFLPVTLVMGTLSLRYSERLIMRFGARTTLLPGLALGVAGLALFTRAPVDGSYVEHVLPVMILLGSGAGVSFPALMTLAMSGATPEDAGLASGLVNTTAQVGGALGLGRARDAVGEPDRGPAGRRRLDRRGAHQRLPPGVPDRRRAGPGRPRRRADRAPARAQGGETATGRGQAKPKPAGRPATAKPNRPTTVSGPPGRTRRAAVPPGS